MELHGLFFFFLSFFFFPTQWIKQTKNLFNIHSRFSQTSSLWKYNNSTFFPRLRGRNGENVLKVSSGISKYPDTTLVQLHSHLAFWNTGVA